MIQGPRGELKLSLTESQRAYIIELLQQGEELPDDLKMLLFPPERKEYELVYAGKERRQDVIAETIGVPLQPDRTFGLNDSNSGWTNMLIFGDNLQVMKTLKKYKDEGRLKNADGSEGVRLVYIDPPFSTKQDFHSNSEEKAYSDKVAGAQFIEFLRKRLIFIYELMADNGLIYVHLDPRKGHYIKIIMDEVFGEHNFMNEITWCYSERELATRHWNRKHDCIYVYAKNLNADSHVFNWKEAAGEYSPGSIRKYNLKSEDGRLYQLRGRNLKDSPWAGKHGVPSHVEVEHPEWVYRDYLDEKEGIRPRDWWSDIPFLNRSADDRYNYPSAKNPKLLDRIIKVCSNPGDIVLDAFAGSGTTCSVAEKLDRRWIAIDCGKLSIYTIQKRMLDIMMGKNKKSKTKVVKPFTLYNAGLYDFSRLRKLPWSEWRFFALQLFGCKDERHTIGGLELDGKYKGHSVLVFNHLEHPNAKIDEDTIRSIHSAIGNKIGTRFFIIAPRGTFDFQQDFLDIENVRYYTMRIPYSFINELHSRQFKALNQPNDEKSVNETVDAVGFDFIRVPKVEWTLGMRRQGLLEEIFVRIQDFESYARVRGGDTRGGVATLSMVLIDSNYNGDVFNLTTVFYAHQLEESEWEIRFEPNTIGEQIMVVFLDVYGNELRVVLQKQEFMESTL